MRLLVEVPSAESQGRLLGLFPGHGLWEKLCPGTYSQRRGPEVTFWEITVGQLSLRDAPKNIDRYATWRLDSRLACSSLLYTLNGWTEAIGLVACVVELRTSKVVI